VSHELRQVTSAVNYDGKRLIGTLAAIELLQLFPQPVHFHADDCVGTLIEFGRTPEDIRGDVVFLNRIGLAAQAADTQIFEQCRKAGILQERSGA